MKGFALGLALKQRRKTTPELQTPVSLCSDEERDCSEVTLLLYICLATCDRKENSKQFNTAFCSGTQHDTDPK